MILDLNFGNAVTGAQRFPRPELEARLMTALTKSAGVKMFELRRIGKSTLRLYAMERFEASRRPFAFIDAQGLHSLADFLSRLMQALPGDKSLISRALRNIASSPVSTALEALSKNTPYEEKTLSAYWQLVSEAIKRALNDGEAKPALIIDEFSYFIDNMIKRGGDQGRFDAEKLLAAMREWRGAGMTMLLTGSLAITGIARRHGLNSEHLNDLQHFAIPELKDVEARAFIQAATETPSQGLWTAGHTDEFLKQCGVLYPCFLVRGLIEIGVEHPAPPDQFAAVFTERVRPYLHAEFHNQFDRRFHAYADLAKEERAKLLLPAMKTIMEAPTACPNEAIPCAEPFSRVDLALALTMLTEDGFIHFTEDAEGERFWKPASRLAKFWWKRSRLA